MLLVYLPVVLTVELVCSPPDLRELEEPLHVTVEGNVNAESPSSAAVR